MKAPTGAASPFYYLLILGMKKLTKANFVARVLSYPPYGARE